MAADRFGSVSACRWSPVARQSLRQRRDRVQHQHWGTWPNASEPQRELRGPADAEGNRGVSRVTVVARGHLAGWQVKDVEVEVDWTRYLAGRQHAQHVEAVAAFADAQNGHASTGWPCSQDRLPDRVIPLPQSTLHKGTSPGPDRGQAGDRRRVEHDRIRPRVTVG